MPAEIRRAWHLRDGDVVYERHLESVKCDRTCLALSRARGSRAITADTMWMRSGGEREIAID